MPDKKKSTPLASADQSQLLIIDVQDKLTAAMPPEIINTVIKNINSIQEMAFLLEVPVHITEQYSKGLGPTDNKILDRYHTDLAITQKTRFSCCQETHFSNYIQNNQQQVIIVGLESHICVLQTALELILLNKKVFIIEDAICSRYKQHHRNALARMANEGIVISNTESLIFEWLIDAKNPHFKTASKLIR